MSFIVTGNGRSATMYLADALDRHPDWNVMHEPFDIKRFDWLCRDMQVSETTGIVDSRGRTPHILFNGLRHGAHRFRTGLLLRHTADIAVSAWNRACSHPKLKHKDPDFWLSRWYEKQEAIRHLYDKVDVVLAFQAITHHATGTTHLASAARQLGIKHLSPHLPFDLSIHKVHACEPTDERCVATYDELPDRVKQKVDPSIAWCDKMQLERTR